MLTKLALTACLAASSTASSPPSLSSAAEANANRIFNSIHHAMRQWGSSLDHNGMSMFLATVPAATEFYHGTSKEQRVNGTQWLAFEPEHALVFANRGGPPGKGGRGRPPPPLPTERHHFDGAKPPSGERGPPGEHSRNAKRDYTFVTQGGGRSGVHTFGDYPPDQDEEPRGGYLHTYRTNKELLLLYVDGQSAAKSDKGTLDVQDLILRDPNFDATTPSNQPGGHLGGPPDEGLRATELCRLAETEWEGKIDGILRMEAGFEVILCSFEDNLDVVSIKQQVARRGGPGSRDDGDQLSYYQAVAARFDGIGGHRVSLDYNSFLSVYAYTNATAFDAVDMPRVVNESSTIKIIRKDVRKMLTLPRSSSVYDIDWQTITDMIVARYANRIESLASTKAPAFDGMQAGLDRALMPFIDYSNRDAANEIARCAEQFLSPEALASTSTAAIAVKMTSETICRSLSDAYAAETLNEAALLVSDLKLWLSWTTWKKCTGCQVDEVCMIPIWPWGTKKDFEHPSCSDMKDFGHGDYWGGRHH